MRVKEIARYHDRLTSLFGRISTISDDEMSAQWARYLCVLTSGFLEVAVRATLLEVAKGRSAPEIGNYVSSSLDAFQNPKMDNILRLVKWFSPTWRDQLEAVTRGRIKDSIDSIVANRHNIAHGRDTGLSYVMIAGWRNDAVKAVEILQDICGL